MSSSDLSTVSDPVYGELTINWKWMLALGILMAVLGVIGLGLTYGLTIISVLWFGVLSLIGGVAQLIDAFKCKGWKSIASHVILGLLYIAAGIVLITMPVQSAWWLTLLIGAMFFVTGIMRIIQAIQMEGSGGFRVFLGLSGLVSILLGVMIYSIVDFPGAEALATVETAVAWFREWGWVIGLFVAIEFIVHGASLIALALAAKKMSEKPSGPGGATAAMA
ncbi:DUF308 domain-containing protein [Acuticoccus sp. M5D2P5]|uniref:HdeD family acid-resistance protein n=1 Tax=Acuticoccus kalidii TaxID=2910977 RepID=UPI001F2E4F27|nr:DUF308 domain-containing protein [Acuticoccus kalidii]MCF3935582.1 DUF308 domain-containing protein [Acuticoccus kalidii]